MKKSNRFPCFDIETGSFLRISCSDDQSLKQARIEIEMTSCFQVETLSSVEK